MDIPRHPTSSGDLQRELQRLEREIEELRVRLARDAQSDTESRRGREGRIRRIARTSRVESQIIGSRPLRAGAGEPCVAPVTSIAAARARRAPVPTEPDDDDGPQAA